MEKIAFVYSIDDERYWKDGLYAALKILEKDYDIYRCNLASISSRDFAPNFENMDFILVWGAFGSRQVSQIAKIKKKKGVCIAGGPINHPDAYKFDVVFVETPWHVREFKKIGIDAKLAFGTNTELFKTFPSKMLAIFYAIYPAAFAKWKRHKLFVEKYGDSGRRHHSLAVGYMQPDGWEKECYEICMASDLAVLPMVTPEVLVWLYNQSVAVAVTASLFGGSERTVLEGLACGCEVEVESDNPKLVELLEENKKRLWTEKDYAKALKGGIESVL